jgi:DNA-binding beta-propeller fold protein YncE
MQASQIIGTAKEPDEPGVLRSASWITVAGNKLFVAEEDSLDASYADDGFVSVFDFSNPEHPKFITRLRPGRELPADFTVAHSLSTSVDEKSVVVESYTSGYVLTIDAESLAVAQLASAKHGFKMPHGAWIAGRKD